MGSPVSVTVANLVMEDVEERALTSFPTPPPFWKRYVDDTCTVILPDLLESFHAHLNSIEPSIDFTYELEEQVPEGGDVLMSRGLSNLWMASDVPLIYGMVVVALGSSCCSDWFLVMVSTPWLTRLGYPFNIRALDTRFLSAYGYRTYRTYHRLGQHSDKSSHTSVLATLHFGDLAHEEPAPPPQPGGRHTTSCIRRTCGYNTLRVRRPLTVRQN